MSPPEIFAEIFDRAHRRMRRDRAAATHSDAAFLRDFMVEGLVERLGGVTRRFADMLDLGCGPGDFPIPDGAQVVRYDPGAAFARAVGGIQGDEDRLPFASASFDLVVSVGVLDTVSDLPGALALARRVLRADGLFLAAFVGAGSLASMRGAFRSAEADRPVARFHPMVDVRSAGDLLVRAGFALPVADTETLSVRYAGIGGLLRDLRAMGATNVLRDRTPLSRTALAAAAAAFDALADASGRTTERFEVIYLTGWAPADTQPKPARRGSATVSLADALRPSKSDQRL